MLLFQMKDFYIYLSGYKRNTRLLGENIKEVEKSRKQRVEALPAVPPPRDDQKKQFHSNPFRLQTHIKHACL